MKYENYGRYNKSQIFKILSINECDIPCIRYDGYINNRDCFVLVPRSRLRGNGDTYSRKVIPIYSVVDIDDTL